MKNEQTISLVFAGGGGKGAYQIGVWRALDELGISQRVSAVSGTSVGAINAALFAQNNYELAKEAWSNLSYENIINEFTFNRKVLMDWLISAIPLVGVAWLGPISVLAMVKIANTAQIVNYVLKSAKSGGIISSNGLEKMINQFVDFNKIKESHIRCYATCAKFINILKYSAETFCINQADTNIAKKLLLASAALPGTFEHIVIDSKLYIDGGVVDNEPIAPIYDEDNKKQIIIVVLLNTLNDREKEKWLQEKQKRFPNATVIPIIPTKTLGGKLGTLDFTNAGVAVRMEKGYKDALQILRSYQRVFQL